MSNKVVFNSYLKFKKDKTQQSNLILPIVSLTSILDEVNENNAILPTEEAEKSIDTIPYTPINLNHESLEIVGFNLGGDIRYRKNGKNELWISGYIWKFLHPELSEFILTTKEVPVSLEFFVDTVECRECGFKTDLPNYRNNIGLCEHLANNSPATLRDITFCGLAVLLPPKAPAVPDASIKVTEFETLPTFDELNEMSSEELQELHKKLHNYWTTGFSPYSPEEIYNCHYLLVKVLESRNEKHQKIDSLDTQKLPATQEAHELNKFLELIKHKKIEIVPKMVSLVGSAARHGSTSAANDLDFLIRMDSDPQKAINEIITAISLQLRNVIKDAKINLNPHFFISGSGPHGTYYPLFDLVLEPSTLTKEELESLFNTKIIPLKTLGGYGEYTFSISELESLYELWASGYFKNNEPILVEEKLDGFRLLCEKKNQNVLLRSEDTETPLNKFLPELVEEVTKLSDRSFILDGELILIADETVKGLNFDYKPGDKIERIDMKSFLKKEPAGNFTPVYYVFDLLFLDEEDLRQKPLLERKRQLATLIEKDTKHIKKLKSIVTTNKEELFKAIKSEASKPYSEGAMLKAVNSVYESSGKTKHWAKVKNYKELIVKVKDVIITKAGTYIGVCVLSDGTEIGKTYATKEKLRKGDIIEVRVAEVKVNPDNTFSWDNPIFHSFKPKGTQLTTPEQARQLATVRRTKLNNDVIDTLKDFLELEAFE